MSDVANEIEAFVLAVHRRNGGKLGTLDLRLGLLDSALGIDSLDLAEINVAIERRFGISPFDSLVPPRTWEDIVRAITARTN